MKRLIINENSLLYCIIISAITIILCEPFEYKFLGSLGTICIFICTILIFVFKYFIKKNKMKLYDYILFFLLAFSFISFVYSGEIEYNNLVPFLCFIEFPILFTTFDKKNRKLEKFIYIFYYILSLFYIYLNFTDLAYKFENKFGVSQAEFLTLGFSNPNQTAMYLCFNFFILIIGINNFNNKFFKLLFILNSLIIYILICKTLSRTAIFIATFYFIVVFLKKQSIFNKVLRKIALFVPIIFVIFILFFTDFYSDLIIMNEQFDTGRHYIFQNALIEFKNFETIIFGDYHQFALQNLHNSLFSIFAGFGIIVTFLFITLIYIKLNCCEKKYCYSTALLGFLMLIVYSSVEAAFVISGSFYAVSFFIVYYLSLSYDAEERDINENYSN